jgi:Holliday junction DNA helicase RuvA
MLAYISGSLEIIRENCIVIDCSGIGYQIFTSGRCIDLLPPIHSKVKLYTHLHIREDDVSLYGFSTEEELDIFELLIGISGIGPKAALAILTALSVKELHLAVVSGDAKAITKANGVGAKGAQRIIIELKDKLKMESMLDAAYEDSIETDNTFSAYRDTVLALEALGYESHEASRAVKQVENRDNMTSDQLLKSALKYLI